MIEKRKEEILNEFDKNCEILEENGGWNVWEGETPDMDKVKDFLSQSLDTAYKAGQNKMRKKVLEKVSSLETKEIDGKMDDLIKASDLKKFLK